MKTPIATVQGSFSMMGMNSIVITSEQNLREHITVGQPVDIELESGEKLNLMVLDAIIDRELSSLRLEAQEGIDAKTFPKAKIYSNK